MQSGGFQFREKQPSDYPKSDELGIDTFTSNGRSVNRQTHKQIKLRRLDAQSHIVFDIPGEYDHTTDLIYKFSTYNKPQRALRSKEQQRRLLKDMPFGCTDPQIRMNSEHMDTFLHSSINQEYNLKENLQCRLNTQASSRFKSSRPSSTIVCRQGPCANQPAFDRSRGRIAS